jgi:peptide/nickel transport system substrate-binding protein
MLIDDVGIIPIHLQKNVWGMRHGFTHDTRVDELTRAQDFHAAAVTSRQ